MAKSEHTIVKVNEAERLVFGWASVSIAKSGEQIADLQGDMIDPAELEKAAIDFMLDYRDSGVMHGKDADKRGVTGTIVESLVFTPEKLEKMGLAPDAIPCRWWIGVKIHDDEVFKAVVDGKYRMFSIEGTGTREEVTA